MIFFLLLHLCPPWYQKEDDIMTVYEALMLMIAFAAFTISFINIKK